MLLTTWLTAAAPMALISTGLSLRKIAAIAPATDFGSDFDDTLNTSASMPIRLLLRKM
jgi:hypothetical protein